MTTVVMTMVVVVVMMIVVTMMEVMVMAMAVMMMVAALAMAMAMRRLKSVILGNSYREVVDVLELEDGDLERRRGAAPRRFFFSFAIAERCSCKIRSDRALARRLQRNGRVERSSNGDR
jgi:hypothetical protein